MQAADLFAETCLADVREDLDQQLIRLSSCQGGGASLLTSPELEPAKDILYELPKTALPVIAPLDSTAIEPGVVVTEQPAPWLASSLTDPAPLPEDQKTTVTEFVKKNPLLIGGLALGVLYLLSKKKKR